MFSVQPNDRVVCIDATPVPKNAGGYQFSDFSFPAGYIVEGEIYCVEEVRPSTHGHVGLRLIGLPLTLCGHPSNWDSLRFRKVPLRSESTATTTAVPIER